MSKALKRFDAVAMMRSARDRLSAKIDGMSVEDEMRWLATQDVGDPVLQRLLDRAAQHVRAADGAAHRD